MNEQLVNVLAGQAMPGLEEEEPFSDFPLQAGDWYEDGVGEICEKGEDVDAWLAQVDVNVGCAGPYALISTHNAVLAELRALRARIASLESAGRVLGGLSVHGYDCPVGPFGGKCNCGRDSAIAALEATE